MSFELTNTEIILVLLVAVQAFRAVIELIDNLHYYRQDAEEQKQPTGFGSTMQ